MSPEETILYINEIKHSMNCEGMPLTEQNMIDITDILQGTRTEKEVKAAILERNGLLCQ